MAFKRDKVLEAAQKHRRKGNWDRALREYQKILAETPQDIRILQSVAEVYLKLNMAAEALDAYRQIAYHYLRDDHFERASAFFKLAIGIDSTEPQLRRDLGQAYHRMGRLKDALIEFNEAYKVYKASNDTHNQRVVLEAMVQLDPEDVPLRVRLAERLVKDAQIPEALDLFEYACARLDEEGRVDEYLQVAERLLHFRKDDFERRRSVVRIHLERSDYKRALSHLQVLFQVDNQDVDTLRQLAFCFEQLGQADKAVMVFKELARVRRNQGQVERSNELYRRILTLNPDDADARNILAHVQRQEQRSLEDSGSLPGMDPRTGPLNASAPQTRPTRPPPQVAPVEIELLDDDLGDLMGLPTQQPAHQPAQPVAQPTPRRPQAPVPTHPTPEPRTPRSPVNPRPQPPRPQAPQRPAVDNSFDLAGAFADDFTDLGEDIELGGLQQLPPMQENPPTLEVEPVLEFEPVPASFAPRSEHEVDKDTQVLLDEADVFIKYGLPHKARSVLIDLVRERPELFPARDALRRVYEEQGERALAADQYIEMANLVRTTPERAASYLERASNLLGNRARVEAIARQRNIPFGNVDATQEDLVELNFLDDADIGGMFEDLSIPAESVPGQSVYELADDEFNLLPDDSLHDVNAFSSVEQLEPSLDIDTDNIMVDISEDIPMFTDDDLLIEDDVLSLHDVDLLSDETDTDMTALPMSVLPSPPEKSEASLDVFGLSENEAETMFDDLFNDFSSANSSSAGVGLQSLSGFGTLSPTDRSEVDRAIGNDALSNPGERRLSLGTQNMTPAANPFGARSLSRNFEYNSVDEMAAASEPQTDPQAYHLSMDQTNTQFELGTAYLEMGLYEEAIAEFRQAVEDPSVADSATLKIAECEVRLGRSQPARLRLSGLIQAPGTSDAIRRHASAMLAKVPG